MSFNFPNSPTIGVQTSFGNRTWEWTGSAWKIVAVYTTIQGIQGLQGIQGRQGVQGAVSRQGTQGTQGLQGVQGSTNAGVTVINDVSTDALRYFVFEDVTSGISTNVGVSSTKLTYNPSTGSIGIGTTNAREKLHSAGISLSGISTSGDILIDGGLIRNYEFIDYASLAPKLVWRRYTGGASPTTTDGMTDLIRAGSFVSQGTTANISGFTFSVDSYTVEFVGYFYAATTGLYTFGVNSDDASDLFIDGKLVAYWYGGHGQNVSGTPGGTQISVYLNKGYHRLYTRFQDFTGADGHEILYRTPGSGTYAVIPASVLYHHPTDLIGGFNDNIALMSGNLGIGSTNPTVPLSVVGNANFTGVITASSFSGSAVLTSIVSTAGSFTQLQSDGPIIVGSATSTGTASQRLQVTGGAYVSGNFGVGTTNPTVNLQLSSTASISNVGSGTTLAGTVGSALTVAQFFHSNTNSSYLRIKATRNEIGSNWTSASTKLLQVTDVTEQSYIEFNPLGSWSGGASGLAFGGPSGEWARFNISGNIGIGTTNPTQKLDVNGTTRLRGGLYDSNNNVGAAGSVLTSTGAGVTWVSRATVSIAMNIIFGL